MRSVSELNFLKRKAPCALCARGYLWRSLFSAKCVTTRCMQHTTIHWNQHLLFLNQVLIVFQETLRQSMSSCRLLATVIDDIADMRKLEAGMLTLFTNPVDVAECMRHAAGMMHPKLGVTVRNEIDPRVGGKRYNLDRHRLEQVGV